MKKLILLLAFVSSLFSQSICVTQLSQVSSIGTSPVIDNRFTKCSVIKVTYYTTFATISLGLESANDAGGVAGTFALSTGSVIYGSNPATATNCQVSNACEFMIAPGYAPWIRLNLSSKTGTGILDALAYAVTAPPAIAISSLPPSATPCPGTSTTPCVVDGPDATGAAPTKPPVAIAGLDSAGNILPLQMATLSFIFDTSTAGNNLLVAASGSTKIYLVKFNAIDVGTGNTFQLKYGTGGTCGVGTANFWQVYTNILTVAEDFFFSPLITPAGQALCLNLTNATRVVGAGQYAQR